MIITSLLDSDMYKFRMAQMILHQFPKVYCEFEFKNRTISANLSPYVDEIKEEIKSLCTIGYTKDELDFLRSKGYDRSYTDFLRNFKLNYNDINITEENDKLKINTSGNWFHISPFEIHILSIVNQIYFRHKLNGNEDNIYSEGRRLLNKKISLLKNVKTPLNIIEFGTRRRFSKSWHEHVTKKLFMEVPQHIIGTSNMLLAKEMNLKPIGSMAHEIFQASQVLSPNIISFQEFTMDSWLKEYPNNPGCVLTDIVGINAFLRIYSKKYIVSFIGGRHDSGDPVKWANKWIKYHKDIEQDIPLMLFSDSLSVKDAIKLHRIYKDYKTSFGIGTNLTNDLGIPALQIVMKMTTCNGKPVAKLSDSEDKEMCNDKIYVKTLKDMFKNG